MIDLHLHTTASDGALAPSALVARAAAAGITTLAITDHDTVAGIAEGRQAAALLGLGFVPGIEITAIWEGSDVHMLGYFVDDHDPRMVAFITRQRQDRERRARAIGDRLAELGLAVDIDRIMRDAMPYAISRPLIARALTRAGHAASQRAAFDTFLAEGCPAFVPRLGATPAEVVALVHDCGGIVSMAHPGVTRKDSLIPVLAEAGLAGLEVYHSDHGAAWTAKYLERAEQTGLVPTGGSDFHGTESNDRELGRIAMPPPCFAAFCARAGRPVPLVARRSRETGA